MAYHFFINRTELPVPPSAVTMNVNGTNTTINLAHEGEVNLIKPTGLTTISFECMLPNSRYPFANTGILGGFGFRSAKHFLNDLKRYKIKKQPVKLLIIRNHWNHAPLFHTSLLCTIENYTVKEAAEHGLDPMVEIEFKEFVPYGTKRVIKITDKEGNETFAVENNRFSEAKDFPASLTIANQMSVLEAVEGLRSGLDWKEVAITSGITNPLADNLKGKVLSLGK